MDTPTQYTPKSFWRKDIYDYIADLGTMKKAIIVAMYRDSSTATGTYFAISPRSYFPFDKTQMGRRFINHLECMQYSEEIVMAWLTSILSDSFSEQKKMN